MLFGYPSNHKDFGNELRMEKIDYFTDANAAIRAEQKLVEYFCKKLNFDHVFIEIKNFAMNKLLFGNGCRVNWSGIIEERLIYILSVFDAELNETETRTLAVWEALKYLKEQK